MKQMFDMPSTNLSVTINHLNHGRFNQGMDIGLPKKKWVHIKIAISKVKMFINHFVWGAVPPF